MATKKKATTDKTTTTKRPPRQVWIVVNDSDPGRTIIPAAATSRAQAIELVEDDDERVVGPYVLAERVGER